MTIRLVHRPARLTRPVEPPRPEQLAEPPTSGDGQIGSYPIQTLIPVVGALSSVVMIVVLRNANPLFLLAGALLLVVALVTGGAMALTQRGSAARSRRAQREHYLDYLETVRARLRRDGRQAREAALLLDPAPAALVEVARDPARRWERRRSHQDFLRVRVGTGDLPWFGLSVAPTQNPVLPHDPIMAGEAQAVVEHQSRVAEMPVTVRLDQAGQVAVIGDRDDVLTIARSLVVQLAAFHSPDDLVLAVAFEPDRAADWAGVDLLPQLSDPRLLDGPVPARRVARDSAGLTAVLGTELTDRAEAVAAARRSFGSPDPVRSSRMVVLHDDWGRVASSLVVADATLTLDDLAVTTVHLLADRLHEPPEVRLRVVVGREPETGVLVGTVTDTRERGGAPLRVRFDETSPDQVATLARMLGPLRLSATAPEEGETVPPVGITELLGIESVAAVGPELWRPRSARDFLRVPVGLDDLGAPVLLDLKESAELGMGPHGICIGATGSGKSEMLRTLVLALALSHPPEDLSMVLVDYKGGAAFAPFAGLPHVAGLIDNLADDPQLVERARTSINGEVVRRQELLRDAGSLPSISHYRQLRRERPDLAPMPHLFVVIDEFGELLTAEPEFVDLLITIGRIGRSIGVHLLLSSQRIEPGKLRGLDTYLSYRIGLRTFSAAESAVVLDTPDAFTLPAVPGYAYLKVDTTVYRRFRSGYVSGPADRIGEGLEAGRDEGDGTERLPRLLPVYNQLGARRGADGEAVLEAPSTGRPLVEACVDRLSHGGAEAAVAPVWLPPLPARVPLGRVLDAEYATRSSGLPVVLGLLDDPLHQRQQPWVLDLSRSGGHAAVIGAPGSGRSTLLRTLAASLALTRTPRQVSLYGMDLSGGGLGRIEDFPHVGGVATRSHRDRLERLLDELGAMLAQREAVFRERGIDSLAQLRTEHGADRVPELVSAEVVLLLDGAGELRRDFEALEDRVVALLTRGGSFGIHVVLAMTRWNDLRMTHQPLIGTRVELRLNDPVDSIVDRKLAATLKAATPGRALTDGRMFGQVALPVLEDVADAEVAPALELLARRSAQSWQGPSAAPIRLLPFDLDPAELPDVLTEPDVPPIGLRQDTMEPVLLDLTGSDQHLLVLGDQGCGKTTVLRTVVRGLLDRWTSDDLVIAVMDVRGDTAGEVPEAYLGGHASTSAQARQLAEAIAEELSWRLDPALRPTGDTEGPPSRVDAAPGSDPRIVVVVDDFDILSSGGTEPLAPLLEFLPSARDLKLHVLLTRPVAGSGRALYERSVQTLRDTGGTLLVMSGERSEGPLLPGLYAEQMVPGRGRMVRRGQRPFVVQVANSRVGSGAEPVDPDDVAATEGRRRAS